MKTSFISQIFGHNTSWKSCCHVIEGNFHLKLIRQPWMLGHFFCWDFHLLRKNKANSVWGLTWGDQHTSQLLLFFLLPQNLAFYNDSPERLILLLIQQNPKNFGKYSNLVEVMSDRIFGKKLIEIFFGHFALVIVKIRQQICL